MERQAAQALDNFITGHFGEDQLKRFAGAADTDLDETEDLEEDEEDELDSDDDDELDEDLDDNDDLSDEDEDDGGICEVCELPIESCECEEEDEDEE